MSFLEYSPYAGGDSDGFGPRGLAEAPVAPFHPCSLSVRADSRRLDRLQAPRADVPPPRASPQRRGNSQPGLALHNFNVSAYVTARTCQPGDRRFDGARQPHGSWSGSGSQEDEYGTVAASGPFGSLPDPRGYGAHEYAAYARPAELPSDLRPPATNACRVTAPYEARPLGHVRYPCARECSVQASRTFDWMKVKRNPPKTGRSSRRECEIQSLNDVLWEF